MKDDYEEYTPHVVVGRRFGKSIPTKLYIKWVLSEYFMCHKNKDWHNYILKYPEWRIKC